MQQKNLFISWTAGKHTKGKAKEWHWNRYLNYETIFAAATRFTQTVPFTVSVFIIRKNAISFACYLC